MKTLFLLPMLVAAAVSTAQTPNRPTPPLVPAYEFVQYDTSNHGYYLTAPFKLGAAIGNPGETSPEPAMILDRNGYLFWYMPVYAQNLLDFKYQPAQQLFSWIKVVTPNDQRFTLMNTDFQLVDSFTTTNGIRPDVHEFNITSNETYLLSGVHDTVMNLSGFLFNGMPGSATTSVIGFAVQEFDEAHQLLFQWKSADYIHPSQAYGQYGYHPDHFDYCHGNTISEDHDGHLLLSFRNLNAVYKINRQTGQVMWRLGGKSNSFTFANDNGFSAQHDVRRLPNGNVTLFDNANMAPIPKISRAVEYSLDTVNWVATKVWEYAYIPGFFSPAMGNHQTTDSRLHLVNYGLNYRPDPSFVLTDDAGDLKSALFFQDSFVSYRSFLFDLPLSAVSRPIITCASANGQVILSAPAGYADYQWSNGETTASISTDEPGVYQVWVNHGIGMLGSEPFFLNDLSADCLSSSAQTPISFDQLEVNGIFDLLGRRVETPQTGELYVVRYSNGRGRLEIWGK